MKRIFVLIIFIFMLSLFLIAGIKAEAQLNQFSQNYGNQAGFPLSQAFRTYNTYNGPDLGYNNYNYLENPLYSRSYSAYSPSGINYQSTWFNYPPISTYGPELPIVFKAGETGMARFFVTDPDYEYFYSSSSIGATGRASDGTPTWSFSTNFPGWYMTQNVFYDIRGGYSVVSSPVYVKPWWSF